MGVVNATPDSFSDGGRFLSPDLAIAQARRLVEEGADLVDLGGESTRPGAEPVPLEQERARVLPVLEGLTDLPIPISLDTRKPEMMQAALERGVSMINDINALLAPGAMDVIATWDCGVCLMHKQGEPQTMQQDPVYGDVVGEVRAFLAARVAECQERGIARDRLMIDPGFGFGKTPQQNLALLRALPDLADLEVPVLVGLSRKSVLGRITGQPVAEREVASAVAAVIAVQQGASLLRVHNVAATRAALLVLNTLANFEQPVDDS